jgi:hypothetical protein
VILGVTAENSFIQRTSMAKEITGSATRVVKWVRPPTYGAPPPARGGHTGVMVGNLFVVFGGTYYKGDSKFAYLNDTWALDIDTMKWHNPKCAGRSPGARYGHAAVVIDFKMYVFGGKGDGGILYNDLWCLDVERWTWEMIPSSTAAPPSARFGHSMISVGDKIALFGGWDGRTANNEFWLFDLCKCSDLLRSLAHYGVHTICVCSIIHLGAARSKRRDPEPTARTLSRTWSDRPHPDGLNFICAIADL